MQSLTCQAKGDPEPKGKFQWKLDDQLIDSNLYPETDEIKSVFQYEPKIEDNGKILKCIYHQYLGEDLKETSTDLNLKIAEYILPQSPFMVDGTQEIGKLFKITLDLQLFPEPETRDLAWIIKNKTSQEMLELQPNTAEGRYSSSFENLDDNKYQAILNINPLQDEDLLKEIYFMIKANENERQ